MVTYAIDRDADLRALDVAVDAGGISFRVDGVEVRSRLLGRFNVWNCLAAMGSARGVGIPLEITEAPFRDLSGPMLDEVRRFTARPETVVSAVIPELIPKNLRHYLLHRQTALFVKRLFLFEERVVLSSVPYLLD